MNKKLFLPISLMLLVGLAVFVSASMTIKTTNENKYAISVTLSQGWNLISGIYPPQQISQDSEIKRGDIKAVYFYSPLEKNYIQIYPNLDTQRLQDYDDESVFSSSMWVYSEKGGILSYDSIVYSDYPSLSTTQLISGWNFLTISSEMAKKSLNEIKGDCNLEKSSYWDTNSKTSKWAEFPTNEKFDLPNAGYGILLKVSSDCKLGVSESVFPIPNLP